MSVINILTDDFSVVTVQNDEDPELVIAQQRNLIRVEFDHDLKFLGRFQAIAGRRLGQTFEVRDDLGERLEGSRRSPGAASVKPIAFSAANSRRVRYSPRAAGPKSR